jgi:hypothetical protein
MISTEPDIQRISNRYPVKGQSGLQIRRNRQNKQSVASNCPGTSTLFLERLYKLYEMKEKETSKNGGEIPI